MKIFQILRENYEILGIGPSQQSQGHTFNTKILFGLFLFGYFMVSIVVYTVYIANDFMEYVQCVCIGSGAGLVIVCFLTIVLQMNTLFESFEYMENLFEKSEKIL